MAQNTQQFLISVADAFLIDKDSDAIVMKSKTLINSAFKQAVQSTPIRGGFGSKKLFDFLSQKDLTASLEDARWDEGYLSIQNNSPIQSVTDNIYIVDEVVTLTSGNGTVAQPPVGNLYVQKADNSIVTITPTGSAFVVAGGANTVVKVTYRYSTSINKIIISADTYPKAYRLILKAKLFQSVSGQNQTAEVEILIENFLPMGNYEITFSDKGAATSKLEGTALVATDATTGLDYYAQVRIRPLSGSAAQLTQIACSPNPIALTAGSPTQQLTVIGIQSGMMSNILNPTGTTYVSGTPATCTVSVAGLITRVATGTSIITATNGVLTDTVQVTCS